MVVPIEKYNNLLIYINKKVANLDDAQDLLQNAYLTLIEKSKVENILDPFSYLFGIVKLNILNYFQVKKRALTNPQKLEVEHRVKENKYSYNQGEFLYDYKVTLENQEKLKKRHKKLISLKKAEHKRNKRRICKENLTK